MENAIIPYQGGFPVISAGNNLSDVGDFVGDLRQMANGIAQMSNSITMLTDFANNRLEELMEYVPPKSVLVPAAIAGGALIVGFLATGIAANVTEIKKNRSKKN
jgi:hypothetical protein